MAVAADGSVYVGQAGQVEIFDGEGRLADTWRRRRAARLA